MTRKSHQSEARNPKESAALLAVPISLEGGVGFRLSRVARIRRSRWAEQLRSLGLTPPQVSVLRGVSDHPMHSLRSLARTLGTDAMSVKRCVDELEARNLLHSGIAPDDRRPRIVDLTKAGERLVGQLQEMVTQEEANLRSLFTKSEYDQLLMVLDRLEEELQVSNNDENVKLEEAEKNE